MISWLHAAQSILNSVLCTDVECQQTNAHLACVPTLCAQSAPPPLYNGPVRVEPAVPFSSLRPRCLPPQQHMANLITAQLTNQQFKLACRLFVTLSDSLCDGWVLEEIGVLMIISEIMLMKINNSCNLSMSCNFLQHPTSPPQLALTLPLPMAVAMSGVI